MGEIEYTRYAKRTIESVVDMYRNAYAREDIEQELKEYMKQDPCSVMFIEKELKGRLSHYGITFEGKKDIDRIKEEIRKIPSKEELIGDLIKQVKEKCESFPTAEGYIERIVNRLGEKNFEKESLRVRILKQFMKKTTVDTTPALLKLIKERLSDTELKEFSKVKEPLLKQQFLIKYIDDSIFDYLDITIWKKKKDSKKKEKNKGISKESNDKITKDDKKEHREKYNLLYIADDLANGKYRTNGRTKKDLYHFAFVYGMTANCNDEKTDIEKNLFYDYYQDNLLRVMSREYNTGDYRKKYEKIPDGAGINYKNFQEAIYVYYLQKEILTCDEKLQRAENMIEECKSRKVESSESFDNIKDITVKSISLMEILKSIKEEELASFICENYYIPSDVKSKSGLVVSRENNTAYAEYKKILCKIVGLDENVKEQVLFDKLKFLEDDSVTYEEEELCIEDADKGDNYDERNNGAYGFDIYGIQKEFEMQKDDTVIKIMKEYNERYKNFYSKLVCCDEKRVVSRTDIVVVYTQWFVRDYLESDRDLDIPELFDEYREGINLYLKNSRFQEFSEKNIIDIFAFLSVLVSIRE